MCLVSMTRNIFHKKGQSFDMNAAQCHQDFLSSLNKHKSEMTETIMQLTQAEEAFYPLQDAEDESYSQDEDLSASNVQKVDAQFQNIFDSLVKKKCGMHNKQVTSVHM